MTKICPASLVLLHYYTVSGFLKAIHKSKRINDIRFSLGCLQITGEILRTTEQLKNCLKVNLIFFTISPKRTSLGIVWKKLERIMRSMDEMFSGQLWETSVCIKWEVL